MAIRLSSDAEVIEKNQRHVCDGELYMLAKALGVTMEWLCGEDK